MPPITVQRENRKGVQYRGNILGKRRTSFDVPPSPPVGEIRPCGYRARDRTLPPSDRKLPDRVAAEGANGVRPAVKRSL